MSQIEDLRKGQSNHEERLQKLESLITPFSKELEEGAKAKAAENFLDDEPVLKSDPAKEEVPNTDPPADLPPPTADEAETPNDFTPIRELNPEEAAKAVAEADKVLDEMSDAALGPKNEAN